MRKDQPLSKLLVKRVIAILRTMQAIAIAHGCVLEVEGMSLLLITT